MSNKLIDLEEIFEPFMKYADEINIFNKLFLLKHIYEIYFITEIYTLLIKYTNVQ